MELEGGIHQEQDEGQIDEGGLQPEQRGQLGQDGQGQAQQKAAQQGGEEAQAEQGDGQPGQGGQTPAPLGNGIQIHFLIYFETNIILMIKMKVIVKK